MTADVTDPGKGDVGAISAAASARTQRAAELREAASDVTAAGDGATADVWTGLSREAFVAAADALAAEIEEWAGQVDAEASALSTYANGLQGIQDQQSALAARRADAMTDLASYRQHKRIADLELVTAASLGAPTDAQERSTEYGDWIAQTEADLLAVDHAWSLLVADREAIDRACIAALSGEEVRGSLGAAAFRGGTAGPGSLAQLSAVEFAVLARTNPDLVGRLGADPAQVHAWWTGLSGADRATLVHAAPAIVGNLEGVAYTDRDAANRLWLDQQITEIRADIDAGRFGEGSYGGAGGYRAESAAADLLERLRGLEGIEKALDQETSTAPRLLISLTGGTPPLAAVAIGDLDTATNVTYAIPGMGSSAEGLPAWAASSEEVLRAQRQADPGGSHAVVAWVGYDAPPVGGPGVLGTSDARAGAANLVTALHGFTATRPDAVINVLAHSYGTTTASIALTSPLVDVDAFVSIGSAGLPSSIDDASDLNADAVYAGQAQDVWAIDPAPGDQWAWVGRSFSDHPVNPVGDDFGAHTFGVDTGQGGVSVGDHGVSTAEGTGYLDRGTESLFNIAAATTGHPDRLTESIEHEPTPFQKAIIGAAGAY